MKRLAVFKPPSSYDSFVSAVVAAERPANCGPVDPTTPWPARRVFGDRPGLENPPFCVELMDPSFVEFLAALRAPVSDSVTDHVHAAAAADAIGRFPPPGTVPSEADVRQRVEQELNGLFGRRHLRAETTTDAASLCSLRTPKSSIESASSVGSRATAESSATAATHVTPQVTGGSVVLRLDISAMLAMNLLLLHLEVHCHALPSIQNDVYA